MLYSILPPILVVLSLVGIIVFFVKRSSRIIEAYKKDSAGFMKKNEFENNIYSRAGFSDENKRKKMEHAFLIFLEKITRKLKTASLKLEVGFNNLSTRIRNKRNKVVLTENKTSSDNNITQEDEIIEKVINYEAKDTPKKEAIVEKNNLEFAVNKEKIVKPMVSNKATLPKIEQGTKNKLEELLIGRVAANPKDGDAYERLGEYYMEIESYIDANECFKQVLKIDPKNKNVKYKIKRLERLLGE